MTDPSPTIALARAQGYRDGYAAATADALRDVSRAIEVAGYRLGPGPYVTALQHARAIVRGLRGRARRGRRG